LLTGITGSHRFGVRQGDWRMAFLNPTKAGGWAWVATIGGILIFVGVFLPWLSIWGFVMVTGFQIGMAAFSLGDGLIIFFVGNIIFIWLFGIAGLALLYATKYRLAMVFAILALAFCTFDLIMYLLIDYGPLLSAGPFVTMAGAVMLTEGARRLARGASSKSTQGIIQEVGSGYGSMPYPSPAQQNYPDYSNQSLYGPPKGP